MDVKKCRTVLNDQSTVTWDPALPFYWTWIGAWFAAAPLAVLVGQVINLLFFKARDPQKPFFSADNWSFLEGKAISTTTTETVETPNPTSLEFAAYFDELMADALANEERQRVVLKLLSTTRRRHPDRIYIA